MLGLLKPKSPLEIREKVWTERRMHWLAQRFGLDRMKSATIVQPTGEFFPNQYNGQPDDVADVFSRVCDFMGTTSDRFELSVKGCCQDGACCDPKPGEKPVVQVGTDDVADQERLIATLARSVAADTLTNSGHLTEGMGDTESLTDLLAVFLGLGIFQANTTAKSTAAPYGTWESWSIRGAGHLQARVPGYAMALMAWVRDEHQPAWASMLAADAGGAFQKGYKYITKTGDCLFRPDNASQPDETRSATSIIDDLKNGTETQQVAAMWALQANPSAATGAAELLRDAVKHRNPGVAAEAAKTIAMLGSVAEQTLPAVLEQLSAQQAEIRAHCAMAVGAIQPELDSTHDGLQVREELAPLLQDRNPKVAEATLSTFALYGKDAESSLAQAVPQIVRYARDCSFELLTASIQRVAFVVDDPKAFFDEYLENTDAEIRDRILGELEALEAEGADESEEEES
jgi:hypothetical protein